MNAGKSDMAAKLAEALVLENKKNPMAWLLLTQVHLRSTERFDLAERSAKKCISLAPKDHRGWLASALALERLGRFEEALGQIKKAEVNAQRPRDRILSRANSPGPRATRTWPRNIGKAPQTKSEPHGDQILVGTVFCSGW